MEAPSPSGIATAIAIKVITIVPLRSGRTPNSPFLNSGVHVVPKRKSVRGTSEKNSIEGIKSEMTIPKVVMIETRAATASSARINFSP